MSIWSWQQGPPPYLDNDTLTPDEKSRLWRRPFWGSELSFALVSLLSPRASDMLLSCNISLPPSTPTTPTTSLTLSQIRQATRSLRWKHPSIAQTVSFPPFTTLQELDYKSGSFLYSSPSSEQDVQRWLDEVVHDSSHYLVSSGGDMDQALSALRRDLGSVGPVEGGKWMFRLYFLASPEERKYGVLMYTGHALTDGCGTFELLDLWLHELAAVLQTLSPNEGEIKWGEEVSRLAKAVPDRVDPAQLRPEPLNASHPVLRALAQAGSMPPPRFGLQLLHPPPTPPSTTANLIRILPPPFAENLRLAARAHGTTVFSTLLAASYFTLLRLCPPSKAAIGGEEEEELAVGVIPVPFDLRGKYLAGGKEAKVDRGKWEVSSAYATGGVVLSRLERFLFAKDKANEWKHDDDEEEEEEDVWTLAREVQLQVGAQAEKMDSAAFWLPFVVERMIQAFLAPKAGAEGTRVPERKVVNVSSLGVMDDSLSPTYPFDSPTSPTFSISNPLFTLVHPTLPPGAGGGLFLPYTWQGEMYLSLSYPEAFFGSVEEQREVGEGTLVGWMERFVRVLERLAAAERRQG